MITDLYSLRSSRWPAIAAIFVLFALSGSAMAEHGCPDGQVPAFQGGTQNRTCVVDYNLPYWQERNNGISNVHVEYYGAAVASRGLNRYWAVWDHISQAEAEKAALDACRSGGGGHDCEPLGWASNSYMSIAKGDAGFFMNFGRFKWLAERNAMSMCKKHSANCMHDKTFDVRAWSEGRRPGLYASTP